MFDIGHLNDLRAVEIEEIAKHFPVGARVLEIGAGTGKQALELKNRGFDVEAIEIASSHYSDDRIFPIVDFDGRHIPFPDASFDVAFSSNVLEHIPDLTQTHAEIARILKPTGYAVHVLPTHVWRCLTGGTRSHAGGITHDLRLALDREFRMSIRERCFPHSPVQPGQLQMGPGVAGAKFRRASEAPLRLHEVACSQRQDAEVVPWLW